MKYIKPRITVTRFSAVDVVTTSDGANHGSGYSGNESSSDFDKLGS